MRHFCHIIPTQLFQWLQCNSAGLWTGNAATIACIVHVLHVSQTGSGKTYTMGTAFDSTMLPQEKGNLLSSTTLCTLCSLSPSLRYGA